MTKFNKAMALFIFGLTLGIFIESRVKAAALESPMKPGRSVEELSANITELEDLFPVLEDEDIGQLLVTQINSNESVLAHNTVNLIQYKYDKRDDAKDVVNILEYVKAHGQHNLTYRLIIERLQDHINSLQP